MKIALVYPKWTTNYKNAYFAKKISVWPPLGLALLGAIAEKDGHQVAIIDGEAEGLSSYDMLVRIADFAPDVVGLTATTPFFDNVARFAQELKLARKQIVTILGGIHITILGTEAFYPPFDFALTGEADYSWPEFLSCLNGNKPIDNVKGLLYRVNGYIKANKDGTHVSNLNTLPIPARHLLDMKRYSIGTLHGHKRFTSIMFSRGCPFSCVFCFNATFGHQARYRSPILIVDEMADVVKKHGISHFYFADDNLTLNKRWVLDFCQIIKRSGMKVTFESSTRANLVDRELIEKLAEAGLIRLSFGLESADPIVRQIACKDVPLEAYEKAAKLCAEYGIEVINSVMLGLPGETKESMKRTISYLRHARNVSEFAYNIAVPYPGTELYRMAQHEEHGLKLLVDKWSAFKRNEGVMQVGDLLPSDFVSAQDRGYAIGYSAWWRVWPMIKRVGIIGAFLTYWRLVRATWRDYGKHKSE